MRGGPARQFREVLPADEAARAALALAQARAAAPGEPVAPSDDAEASAPGEETSHATAAGKAGQPPQPAAGDAPPTPAAAPDAPLHIAHPCKTCERPIYWVALLDEKGQRIPRSSGKGVRTLCVDAEPTPDGTVQLFHREGEGIVARILRRGAARGLRRIHPYPCTRGT